MLTYVHTFGEISVFKDHAGYEYKREYEGTWFARRPTKASEWFQVDYNQLSAVIENDTAVWDFHFQTGECLHLLIPRGDLDIEIPFDPSQALPEEEDLYLDYCYMYPEKYTGPGEKWALAASPSESVVALAESYKLPKICESTREVLPFSSIGAEEDQKTAAKAQLRRKVSLTQLSWPRCVNNSLVEHVITATIITSWQTKDRQIEVLLGCPECAPGGWGLKRG